MRHLHLELGRSLACSAKNSSGDCRFAGGGTNFDRAARRLRDSLGKTSQAAAPAATGSRSSVPGQPNRSAHRLGARQVPRQPRDWARAGLPRPRLIGGAAHGDARRSVRRPLGRGKSLLVRAAELPRARIDPGSSTRRFAAAWLQRSSTSCARAAYRARHHRRVGGAAAWEPWHTFECARPLARLLWSANRRDDLQPGRGY
jgi:hypothetical protein